MKRKQIVFTAPRTAELLETDVPALSDKGVLVKTEYTVVSGGTERANLMGLPNVPGQGFPKSLGYCGIGYVLEIGKDVKTVGVGDRVLVYHGVHSNLNVREEDEITKVENASIPSVEAAFTVIASMGLGGVRKLEFGAFRVGDGNGTRASRYVLGAVPSCLGSESPYCGRFKPRKAQNGA